jgi:hypothetical protein
VQGWYKRGGHGRRPNGRVGAFLDLFGGGYVNLAVSELRVPAQRAKRLGRLTIPLQKQLKNLLEQIL